MEEIESGLPDWMRPFENEGFDLGPEATACLMDWEWRDASRRGRTTFQWITHLREFEMSNKGFGFDGKTAVGFIRKLPIGDKKDLFRKIHEKSDRAPWKEVLSSTYSVWSLIYKDLHRGNR